MALLAVGCLNVKDLSQSQMYKHSAEGLYFLIDLTIMLIVYDFVMGIHWPWYIVLSPVIFLVTLVVTYAVVIVVLLRWMLKDYDRV